MSRSISAVVLIVAGLLAASAGCRPKAPIMKPSAPAPQPASQQRVSMLRQMYEQRYPDSRVGIVIATLPDHRMAAVGDIPVKDIAINETVTFIDGEENVLTTGVVINKTEDAIHVKYDPFAPGHREPRVGDLAVRFK